ncbi:hypothetical protein Goshw_013433 [Gossypium schwendimanii]|uniref:DUF4283 domain-containing protein n=1 Tax=Gossypium schwendimanii TaxID=34291 RepID=A0A7J9MZY7_GOSSC|nr:hypothetical protein [Gossypium schwendimanii]
MEDELANLSLVDDEEEAIEEEATAVESISQFYLVERCLTNSVVHFPSLRNTMADLCHPIRGICITDIEENGIYSNSFMRLTLLGIPYGENPAVLELNFTEFWIQVYELPPGLMFESIAKQLGNFCGKFLEAWGELLSFQVKNGAIKNYFWLGFMLRAEVRRWATEMSRWLRETDGSQDRQWWRDRLISWVLKLDQALWIYRLALVNRAAGFNKNTKLECSWFGEITNNKEAQD